MGSLGLGSLRYASLNLRGAPRTSQFVALECYISVTYREERASD